MLVFKSERGLLGIDGMVLLFLSVVEEWISTFVLPQLSVVPFLDQSVRSSCSML